MQNKHITPARRTSLDLLNKILVSNEPFEKIILSSKKFLSLDDKDKRFTRLIITTVLRKFGQIDFIINQFIKRGSIKKIEEHFTERSLKLPVKERVKPIEWISAKYKAVQKATG